jgi:dihydrodipicolinate synthase/N-acetylneuraminate lyase
MRNEEKVKTVKVQSRALKEMLCGNGPTFPLFRLASDPLQIDWDLTKQHIRLCLMESGCGDGCGNADTHFAKIAGGTAFKDQMEKETQMEVYSTLIPFIKGLCDIPVLADISSNEPRTVIVLAESALKHGADILVITPPYNTSLKSKEILRAVRDAYPKAKIVFHAAKNFEPIKAREVVELAKNGLINGLIWNFEKHGFPELMEVIHHSYRFRKNDKVLGKMPKNFVFGTDTENFMMAQTSVGGRFCVSRSANLHPIITSRLTHLHNIVRINNWKSSAKQLRELYNLIYRTEKDSPRNLLYMLSMMHPEIYGDSPVLPPIVAPLSVGDIQKIAITLANYDLLPGDNSRFEDFSRL